MMPSTWPFRWILATGNHCLCLPAHLLLNLWMCSVCTPYGAVLLRLGRFLAPTFLPVAALPFPLLCLQPVHLPLVSALFLLSARLTPATIPSGPAGLGALMITFITAESLTSAICALLQSTRGTGVLRCRPAFRALLVLRAGAGTSVPHLHQKTPSAPSGAGSAFTSCNFSWAPRGRPTTGQPCA